MDAAETFPKRIALLIAAALLAAVPASAQLSANVTAVNLTGTVTSVPVTISSTSSTSVSFTIAKDANFYNVDATLGTASSGSPFVFNVSIGNLAGCSTNPCNGTITITPASGNPIQIAVNFTPGGGGGGGGVGAIVVNPNPPAALSAVLNGTASGSVTLATANGSTVSCTITSNVNWLLLSAATTTLTGTAQTLSFTAYAYSSYGLQNNYQYQAIVTVCGSTASQTQFTVTLNVGTPGGTGTYTVSPTSVALQYPTGNTSQSVTVGSSLYTTYYASLTTDSGGAWLFFNGSSSSTYNTYTTGAATISVNSTVAASLATGTYAGHIVITNPYNLSDQLSIPVSLAVNGGGGGSGNVSVSPTAVTLTASLGGYSEYEYPTVSTTSTTAVNCSITTNPSGSWLLTYPSNITNLTSGAAQTIIVYANTGVGGLSNNTQYTGTVTICGTATVNVTLNIGNPGGSGLVVISPNPPATLQAALGTIASGSVSLYTSNGSSLNCTVGSSQSWLVPQGYAVTLTGTAQTFSFTAYAYSTYVSNNTQYQGIITLSCGTTSAQFTVTLNVGNPSGGGTGGIAQPTSLAFAYQSNWNLPRTQNVTVAASGTFTATASVNTAQQWLKLSTGGTAATSVTGTGPGQLTVSIDSTAASLTSSTYSGSITISTPAGTQTVQVTLLVTLSPVIQSNPGSINVSWAPGSANPTQYIQVPASDGETLTVSLNTSTSWITLSGANPTTTTAGLLLVSINPSSLCNGLNVGAINVTAANAANSSSSIPVVVLVSNSSVTGCGGGGGPAGALTLGAGSLSFTAAVNGSAPATQTLGVTASTATTFVLQIGTTSGGNWLSVSQNGVGIPSGSVLTTPANLVVAVTQAGLAVNTYNGELNFVVNGVSQSVPVTLVVSATGGGNLTVSPTSLTFSTQAGGAATSQDLSVTSASGGSGTQFTVAVATTSGGSWLSVNVSGTPVTSTQTLSTPVPHLTVSVNPQSLAAGTTYQGTVTLTPTGGTVVQVPITVTTSAATVTAAPAGGGTSLTFNYRAGDTPPAAQNLNVTGGSGLTWSATAQSNGNWLSVSPAAGTTPGTVAVSVSPTSLSAGTYNGSVTVAGTGTATGSTTIQVTLTVTAPLPNITSVGNAGSYVGGNISPGEIITIFGTGLGPTPPVTSPTVDATGLVTKTLGQVQVTINGFPCPMLYASNTQVTAVVPYELARYLSATIIVQYLGQTSQGISAGVVPAAPALFTANASGTGPGAILNPNLTLNSPGNPANKGDTVALYMTGEGQTSPPGVTGKVTVVSAVGPLTPQPLLAVGVTINGQPAAVAFYGEAPGLVSGVMQVNVVIPPGLSGSGNLPIKVAIGNAVSPDGVTISVR